MHLDPLLPVLCAVLTVVLALAIALRRLRQPHVVAFIVAGLLSLRMLGDSWQDSLYAGALLAQIGELSFLLAAVGRSAGIIGSYSYDVTIGTIALTLTPSPAWIGLFRRLVGRSARPDAARRELPAERSDPPAR